MKAIIPVAGPGTRLRPFTYTQPKALIPVAGKPILGFIIEQLQSVGVTEFVFVLGYLGDKIRGYVEDKHPNIKAYYTIQEKREGLGHAIWTAKDLIQSDEEILIVLGDTIIEVDLESVVHSEFSSLGVKKVEDPWNFGVVEVTDQNRIVKVVEKPKFPKSNLALVGVYKIKESNDLFVALDNLVEARANDDTQIHLADAIQVLIDKGYTFTSFKVDHWYDCGKVEILLETNATLLKKYRFATQDLPEVNNSIIVQPVSIAKSARISNSIIGPNVTIGEDAEINYSILNNSIIGDFARLNHVILKRSVIGSDAYVKGLSQSLNIGDNTEIDLSGE